MTFRVSKDPADKAYTTTAWQRRVWHKDREITDWITADEFRRVVLTPNGVLNGSVRIERLPEDTPLVDPPKGEVPIDAGFTSGVFVHVPDQAKDHVEKAKDPDADEAQAETNPPSESDPPGLPDDVVDEPQSTRLSAGTTQV